MVIFAELMGVFLVGYGIWFSAEGVKKILDGAKDWWRPVKGRRRYPYPVSGILLGVCFVLMGLVFALSNTWQHHRDLAYAGGGMFVFVLIIGVGQPRFLHPRWYGELEDRFGRDGMLRLKRAALQVDDSEWKEIVSTEAGFAEWVSRTMPREMNKPSRGYRKGKPARKE
jgi:hypothetical protein